MVAYAVERDLNSVFVKLPLEDEGTYERLSNIFIFQAQISLAPTGSSLRKDFLCVHSKPNQSSLSIVWNSFFEEWQTENSCYLVDPLLSLF